MRSDNLQLPHLTSNFLMVAKVIMVAMAIMVVMAMIIILVMVAMVMVVMVIMVVIRLFHKTQTLEIHIAQSGFLVLGSIETNVRKCVFSKYVSFP